MTTSTVIKEEREDSENDEIEHESAGESDKSISTSDSSDGSDSEDSSELDEEECERRRIELSETLLDLERQFALVKEQLYRERVAEIKSRLEEVQDGTAKEYTEPLQELQENMRNRIEVAGVLKKLRMENIENGFRAEEQAARQNFENEKCLLYDLLKEEIEEKMRRLDEDRNNIDIQLDIYTEKSSRTGKNGRSWRRGGLKDSDTGRRKPVTVSGPFIVYMLSDAEIMEDWAIIKKVLSNTKRSVDRKY